MLETYRQDWVAYTQAQTLCAEGGCSEDQLVRVAVKEITDNALDASPRGIEFSHHDRTFTVQDFGAGLAADHVLRIFDITRESLSSKRWRMARRGALGNGTRVVMGVVSVSGGYLDVESCGVGQRLTIRADGVTIAEPFETDVFEGTRISLTVGPRLRFNVDQIVRFGTLCQSAIGSAFGGTKAVPAWFNFAALKELVRDARDKSAMEFAKQFDITPDAMASIKAIASRTTASELLIDEDRLGAVCDLILTGQKGTRVLKRMGRNARPGNYGYIETTFTLGGVSLPVYVEAWAQGVPVENRQASGEIICDTIFTNRTPALTTRKSGSVYDKIARFGIGGELIRIDLTGPCNFDVELAITAPELPLVSKSKDIDFGRFEGAIDAALTDALRKAYVSPTGTVQPKEKSQRWTIKSVVYSIIEDVYNTIAAHGIGAPARMIYYRCRPFILSRTGRKQVSQATFNACLDSYLDDFPDLTKDWIILRDDRGHFHEPAGVSIGIGTLSVSQYITRLGEGPASFDVEPSFSIDTDAGTMTASRNPAHRFSALIFVEKEGYTELIQKAGIANEFDVAFASTKGMPTEAVRRLVDALAFYGVKTFCLHDFDPAGLTIANTLSTSNDRYTFTNDLDFVDMGVRLIHAEALGLDSEPYTIGKKQDPHKLAKRLAGYGATPAEINMLVWDGRRVEIDAMTPQQLIDFIKSTLRDHGVKKVVPDAGTLAAYFKKEVVEQRLEDAVEPLRKELQKRFDELAEEIADEDIEIPDTLESRVREIIADNPATNWLAAVQHIAANESDAV